MIEFALDVLIWIGGAVVVGLAALGIYVLFVPRELDEPPQLKPVKDRWLP